MHKQKFLAAAAVCGLSLIGTIAPATTAHSDAPADVTVQLLSITDFHSGDPQDPSSMSVKYSDGTVVPFAGTEYLAPHLAQLRAQYPNTVTWSNGDNLTAYNWVDKGTADEYGAEKYNKLGMEFYVIGNHDMDWRIDRAQQILKPGGCTRPGFEDCLTDSTGQLFNGVTGYGISSNLLWTKSGKNIWQSYAIKDFVQNGRHYKVGIIGATIQGSERWPMSYNEKITSTDRVAAIDKASDQLASMGVNAQVLSMHEGGNDTDAFVDTCVKVTGPAIDVAKRVSPRISAIITGHTHHLFNCQIPGPDGVARPVVQAGAYGQAYSQILLTLDGSTGAVKTDKTVSNLYMTKADIAPDASIVAMNTYWNNYANQRAGWIIGKTTGDITLTRSDSGEEALGDVAADAMLWSSKQKTNPAADLAIVSTKNGTDESGWNSLTHEAIVGVKQRNGSLGIQYRNAFESYGQDGKILTVSFTGEQIVQILEQQWQGSNFYPLAVSGNVHYSYDASMSSNRVLTSSITINGKPLQLGRVYRVAINAGDYATGGHNSNTALTMGWNPQTHLRLDEQVMVDYIRSQRLLQVPTLNRVTKLG